MSTTTSFQRETPPFPQQMRQNLVSTSVIGLSIVALFCLSAAFVFQSRLAAVVYFAVVYLKWPMRGLIVLGAFFDRSKVWLLVATVSASCRRRSWGSSRTSVSSSPDPGQPGVARPNLPNTTSARVRQDYPQRS